MHRAAEKVEARKRRSNDQRIWERQLRCEEGLRGETKRVSRGYKLKRRQEEETERAGKNKQEQKSKREKERT